MNAGVSRFRTQVLLKLMCLLLAVTLLNACGDDEPIVPPGESEGKEATPKQDLSSWAIHIYTGPPGKRVRRDFKPVDFFNEAPVVDPSGSGAEPASIGPGNRTQATVGKPGLVEFNQDNPENSNGWQIVAYAALECGVGTLSTGQAERPNPYIGEIGVVYPPWGEGAWYIYGQDAPIHCDNVLALQENMLCVADKLAEIGSAVGTIEWSNIPVAAGGPWTIPPQSEKDRFIVRDLAINVLAHIAYADMMMPCDLNYASIIQTPSLHTTVIPPGVPAYFPPAIDNTEANAPALGEARLNHKATILRASAELLHNLIRDSVFADLAGTERRRALASDPLAGNKLAWGAREDGTRESPENTYNTLAHALRVVAGRWELSREYHPFPSPRCPAFRPDARRLLGKYGFDLSARFLDVPVTTAGQQAAVRIVDRAAIVIPTGELNENNPQDVRNAVLQQSLATAAIETGHAADDPIFMNGPHAEAIRRALLEIGDADLRFALERNFNIYRLLNPTLPQNVFNPPFPDNRPFAGMSLATFQHPALEAVGGRAFAEPLPRGELGTDFMARAAHMLTDSQCSEAGGENLIFTDQGSHALFQDSFALGQGFYKRLVSLRAHASQAGAGASTVSLAAAGAAAVRTWAGSARMTAFLGAVPPLESVVIEFAGFEPNDVGVSTDAEMSNAVVLAWGPPWVADCAAGLRKTCPEDLDEFIQVPTFSLISPRAAPPDVYARGDGVSGNWTFVIPQGTDSPKHFRPVAQPDVHSFNPDNNELYVVARRDPRRSNGVGRVLGPVRLIEDANTGTIISPMQRELLNAILGFDDQSAVCGATPRDRTGSVSPSYCIDGVQRDLFVPLENELTSDSDQFENSWRHYLTLAREAATRADTLANELIEIGLQQDFRREAAGEAVAGLCGDYGTLDNVTFENGNITPGATDEGLKACLNEEKVDVVFLASEPTEEEMRELFGCDDTPQLAPALCAKLDADTLTTEGLGLVDRPPPPSEVSDATCANAVSAVGSLRTGFQSGLLTPYGQAPWMVPESIKQWISGLRVEMREDGGWRVVSAGEAIMDSAAGNLWPGCHRTTPGCVDPTTMQPSKIAADFDAMFRDTTGPLGNQYASANEEASMLLWRVQGAAWTLASLGGEFPDGLFTVMLPAVDYGTGAAQAPLLTVYSHGKFSDAGTPCTEPDGSFVLCPSADVDAADHAEMRPVRGDSGSFAWSTRQEVPAWLSGISAATAQYKFFLTEIPQRTGKTSPGNNLPIWMTQRLNAFNGMVCTGSAHFAGNPANLPAGAEASRVEVAKLRTMNGFDKMCSARAMTVTFGPDLNGQMFTEFNDEVVDLISLIPLLNGTDVLPGYPRASDPRIWNARLAPVGSTSILPAPTPNCSHPVTSGVLQVASTCAVNMFRGTSSLGSHRQFTRRMLQPQFCKPWYRAHAFLNSYPPVGACGAAGQLAQALALGCKLNSGGVYPPQIEVPQLQKIEDILALERWVAKEAQRINQDVGSLFIQNLPKRVVDDLKARRVGSGNLQGAHGGIVLRLEGGLTQLVNHWLRVGSNFAQIGNQIQGARHAIMGADIAARQKHEELALEEMKAQISILEAAADAASPFETWSSFGAKLPARAAQIAAGLASLAAIDNLRDLNGDAKDNAILVALNTLRIQAQQHYLDLQLAVGDLRTGLSDIAAASYELEAVEDQARYETAKGAGQDYVVDSSGRTIFFPVNTVLRRRYDITQRRYKRALEDAKRLAYIARLAIEQRIGTRFSTITAPVGPIDPPAQWADDVCSLVGIDYQKLRTFDPEAGGGTGEPDAGEVAKQEAYENRLLSEFADQYIGDYVNRLEQLVEYYNIQFPSHDGDDRAVVSLRDDLLAPKAACTREAPNLLLYSDRLDDKHFEAEGSTPAVRGWSLHGCEVNDTKCLRVESGDGLSDPKEPPGAYGGVTWLRDESRIASTEPLPPNVPVPTTPLNAVYQAVDLVPGIYVLSWWAQARTATGALAAHTTMPANYPVAVRAENGADVAAFVGTPFVRATTTDTEIWGPRQALEFTVKEPGRYYVAFAASLPGSAIGSVALANPQLEYITNSGAGPSRYITTGSSRSYVANDCGSRSRADLQGSFRRACEADGRCYFELTEPISIATLELNEGRSRLNGKLAAGNFNFRHIDIGLNLVGSGVRDCGRNGSPACFGSGYVEYSLHHDAYQSAVLGRNGAVQCFNFGSASINHGKALAAERFITLPLGSADSQLLEQPGINKTEFRGRPLDGAYRLRIWETPDLAWNQLEDIQLILTYRYWSPIHSQPGSN